LACVLDESDPLSNVHLLTDRRVFVRRLVFLALVTVSIAVLLMLAALALSADGFGATDLVLLVLFGLTTPWLAVGFWNAAIGLFIMRLARDPSATVIPQAARTIAPAPIVASTAIVMCVRNEAPDRVVRNLDVMIEDMERAGCAGRFHVYVLSDTSRPDIAVAEEKAFATLSQKWASRLPLTYRRRETNTGFKAGNIRDFLVRWGDAHDLMVTLDADSFMTASALLRMVRVVQGDPRLGILQGLVVGMPSTSAFARLFQFGMRLGLRSWTIGSAWWQADCGPYWGHNAVIRIAPFKQHCAIPSLPGRGILRGHVLSHDQIEAALMRRAGYDVRVLPEEDLGWEENPPTLVEFIRRDQRWCQGTLQYVFFIGQPGLKIVSRIQLIFAMLMFTGSPAWIGLLLAGTVALAAAPNPATLIDARYGVPLLVLILSMWFAPKVATMVDVLTRPALRRAFGGGARFLASVAAETIFSLLLSPIMWACHTLFLAGLPFGRAIGWAGQVRDDHTIAWTVALHRLWPQTLLGSTCLAIVAILQPAALPYVFVLLAGGLVLAIPFCVVTSWPLLGRALARAGIGRLPEETAPSAALKRLGLPALATVDRPGLQGLRTGLGVLRSLRLYYGNGARSRAMDALYGQFIRPGDLVFDVGAHVGDRVSAFRRLGARVVAVEPQPALHRTLGLLFSRDAAITLTPSAVGRSPGHAVLRINIDNPTISTLSDAFIAASRDADGWQGQSWPRSHQVSVTTLDALIETHGVPSFIKLDIEGFEAEALAGLSQPVAALSFEFTTIQRAVALACLERCAALGYTRFNAALGESQALGEWRGAGALADWLTALPHAANSGDIYARRG
jgi:membrane glycosyltransferase